MTDSQYLFAVLAIVYLLDCGTWVHAQSTLLWWRRHGRGHWSIPSFRLGNPNGGFALKPIFPPVGFSVLRFVPFSMSPDGLLSFASDAPLCDVRSDQPERYVAWSDVERVDRNAASIYCNGVFFAKAGSPAQAQWAVDALRHIHASPEHSRAQVIEELLRASFDIRTIESLLARHEKAVAPLHSCALLLLMFFFVAAPIWTYRWGLLQTWPLLVSAIVLIDAAVIWQFFRANCILFGDRPEGFWSHVFSMILNPIEATRACDRISRDLLCPYHPLAAAYVLCPRQTFESFARAILVDVRYPLLPICTKGEARAVRVEVWWRERRRCFLEEFLAGVPIEPEGLLKPEPACDPTARSFCPRCQRQYEHLECLCEPCGGIPTRRWT